MPTETAATWPCSGFAVRSRRLTRVGIASGSAAKPAGDRGRARAAVGLQHVAVDRDRALAERLHVDHRAQAAADQPLDLLRAPALPAARGLAGAARMGRTRQHAVLGRNPAL